MLSVPALLLCPPSLRVSETYQQVTYIVQQMLPPIIPRIQVNYRMAGRTPLIPPSVEAGRAELA